MDEHVMDPLLGKECVGMLNLPKALEEERKVVMVVQFLGGNLKERK
jgi:hypothetical protein